MRCWLLTLALTASPTMVSAQQTTGPGSNTVLLRIIDFHGAPVTSAHLTLFPVMGDRAFYTTVRSRRDEERTLSPSDFRGDHAVLDQLPTGRFAWLVEAEHMAPTCSSPFELPGNGPAKITVAMTRGGVIEGALVDEQQRAVVGATVEARVPEVPTTSPFCVSSGNFLELPPKGRVTRTDDKGRFRLQWLAGGKYDLVSTHPDFAGSRAECTLSAGEQRSLAPIELARGTVVEGVARIHGVGAAGISVVISLVSPAVAPRDDCLKAVPLGQYRAVTDATGAYRFDQRIAPGRWKIAACKPSEAPFDALIQMRDNACPVEIPRGRDLPRWTKSFDL